LPKAIDIREYADEYLTTLQQGGQKQ